MLKLMLNNQYRKRLFLTPALLLLLGLFTNYYIIAILMLQNRFTNVFRNSDFNLKLYLITGKGLGRYLQIYNLSWVVWFNLWFLASKTVYVFYMNSPIYTALIDLTNFNIILFISFVVGNAISNSDMITISNSFLRSLGSSFVFCAVLSVAYPLLYGITLFKIAAINILLLLLTLTGWQYSTRKQSKIRYIQYYYG